MSLTVLNVAFPLAHVSANSVGGAEQVLATLDRALVERGHQSVVVACEGSEPAGELLPVLPRIDGVIDDKLRSFLRKATQAAIEDAVANRRIDVVHYHGLDFAEYLPCVETPSLATLHLPPDWYSPEVFGVQDLPVWLHCVSMSQQNRCPPSPKLLPPIENGVDLRAFRPGMDKGGFALALGRVCPEKGFDHAVAAARASDSPLLIGGQVFPYPSHQQYFRQTLEPLLDDRRRFIGPVGQVEKIRLLRAARCLLIPSLAAETSSLVAMEAMACGTPVIAYRSGALCDIVTDGETGFLVNDPEEMACAIRRSGEIDGRRCRSAAEERFGSDRMIDRYLHRYAEVAARH
jgi:glycosyltransferase involved in cell wall biosynthesis